MNNKETEMKMIFGKKSKKVTNSMIYMVRNKTIMTLLAALLTASILCGCGNAADSAAKTPAPDTAKTEEAAVAAVAAETETANTTDEAKTEEAAVAAETETANTTDEAETEEIIVFAAASLTDVAAELESMYEAEHKDTDLLFSFGSSGALKTQIEEGAPADVFISAAKDHMEDLVGEGLIEEDSSRDLLLNKLVLVVPKDSELDIASFDDLTGDKITIIGMGEPESVPAGKYAMKVLEKMGIYDSIKDKMNYGTDVRQVLTWTEGGEVDCGLVYATDAYTTDDVKIICEAPEDMADKIIYPEGLTKEGASKERAKDFADFLESDEAMKVFEKYGFQKADQ